MAWLYIPNCTTSTYVAAYAFISLYSALKYSTENGEEK